MHERLSRGLSCRTRSLRVLRQHQSNRAYLLYTVRVNVDTCCEKIGTGYSRSAVPRVAGEAVPVSSEGQAGSWNVEGKVDAYRLEAFALRVGETLDNVYSNRQSRESALF